MNSRRLKNSAFLSLLLGGLLVGCGGVSDSDPTSADESVGSTEAALCADGTCNCVAPDCDALNWTFCKGTGTATCSWVSGTACMTATCRCSGTRMICP
ncbi:hypothetical protein JY651_17560 [Pyxidicoccus parkwayensis]|uniref:Lipoprotein n=1 Tax=Pyxidicoccus parkwayensis TaxID=2813578 RepID=A0ABX7P831_9BACT|nr:hypothetical protein [Pyxidicoccus parkwaysis]QSQ26626.1 hypothetical protein JY651_17560 [Pyxidicoccus parkwaysis]